MYYTQWLQLPEKKTTTSLETKAGGDQEVQERPRVHGIRTRGGPGEPLQSAKSLPIGLSLTGKTFRTEIFWSSKPLMAANAALLHVSTILRQNIGIAEAVVIASIVLASGL